MTLRLSSRDWALDRLREHDRIVSLTPIGERFIKIERKKYESFNVAIIGEKLVRSEAIENIVSTSRELQFIVNLPKQGIWTGDAIVAVEVFDIGWGGLGDLMSAINLEEVCGFQKKEYDFVERGFEQHDKVQRYCRIFDRVYKVVRNKYSPVVVALVNEYDLTAEHVRNAREKYGTFSIIVKTNPNGRITEEAHKVAKHIGIDIFGWGAFLGRLSRP